MWCLGPGSFLEVTKVIDELVSGGGSGSGGRKQQEPAFHVVALSLPNYGFSEGSKKKGFAIEQYAETCHRLMLKLGYSEYVTQGGVLSPSPLTPRATSPSHEDAHQPYPLPHPGPA